MPVATQIAREDLVKKIARTVSFKDRLIHINDELKSGKNEDDLKMSVFEIEVRAKDGNFKWIKRDDAKFVKLFSWGVIRRSIDKIHDLRERLKNLDLQVCETMGRDCEGCSREHECDYK